MSYPLPDCCFRVSAKALILNEAGHFLICQEDNGCWDLPGGGLEHDEDFQTALRRELAEEMGLVVVSSELRPSYAVPFINSKGKPSINVIFITRVRDLEFTPSEECRAIQFVDPARVEEVGGAYSNVVALGERMRAAPPHPFFSEP